MTDYFAPRADNEMMSSLCAIVRERGLYTLKEEGEYIVYDKNHTRVDSIREWILSECSETLWQNPRTKNKKVKFATNFFNTSPILPLKTRERCLFWFKNGWYDAEGDYFGPLQHGIVPSCGQLVVDFDVHLMKTNDWRDIQTPLLSSLLATQGIVRHVEEHLFVFLGRMLYDIGTHDSWKCVVFLEGDSDTKNVICKFMCKLYDVHTIALLGGTKTFVNEVIDGKFFYVAHRICSDAKIRDKFYDKMVSSMPGIFAGDRLYMMEDKPNVVLFPFHKCPPGENPHENYLLYQEASHIVVKANRAYREYARKYKSHSDFVRS